MPFSEARPVTVCLYFICYKHINTMVNAAVVHYDINWYFGLVHTIT